MSGVTLIFGVLRIVNFAHGEFLMLAMYGAWAFTRLLGLNPYIAAVAVVPAMFLFGGEINGTVIAARRSRLQAKMLARRAEMEGRWTASNT